MPRRRPVVSAARLRADGFAPLYQLGGARSTSSGQHEAARAAFAQASAQSRLCHRADAESEAAATMDASLPRGE
jgi:hypothetical protein